MAQNPKPATLAMIGADAEFPRNALEGVRSIAKKYNLKIVYDKNYPPATADYTPVVRAVAATNPDIFFAASYPPDSVGIIRASHEIGFKPKIYGGGMVGLQATAIKTQLGPLLNDIVVYDFWLPWAGFATDAGRAFVKKYQTKSAEAGVDLLGYYLPPFGYALMQVIDQAVTGAGTTEDAKLADFMRKATFKTVVGDFKFNAGGEWETAQVMAVQFQGVQGNGVDRMQCCRDRELMPVGDAGCAIRSCCADTGEFAPFRWTALRLLAWCIMPNHVHDVVEPMDGHTLGAIVKSWKSFTSRKPMHASSARDHSGRPTTSIDTCAMKTTSCERSNISKTIW